MNQAKVDYINRNDIVQEQYTCTSQQGQSKPAVMLKRIGSTTYRVNVHFSQTGTEDMSDKIMRLIKREAV